MKSKVQYINSITRALDILRLFDSQNWELGIQEISNRLAMNKTTVFRVVKTLEINGFLIQNPINSKYYPGFAILEMAHDMFQNFSEKSLIYPFMQQLQSEFNEDIVLSVLNGTNAICIERLESNNGLRLSSHVGRILPLYAGATGKVFLPYLPPEILESVLSCEKETFTMYTKIDRPSLEKDIESIRKNGYIISISEMDLGVSAIAVPIFDGKGKAAYSLGVCGSTERLESKDRDQIIKRLLEISSIISKRLGYLHIVQR